MDKTQLWSIVGISIVVPLAVTLLMGIIAGGNEPQLAPVYGSGMMVYTKADIDASFANVPTKAEVYSKAQVDAKFLNFSSIPKNCMAHSFTRSAYKNGTSLCYEQTRNKCLISEATLTLMNSTAEIFLRQESHFFDCNRNFEFYEREINQT